jgi:hypothetical protein
MEPDEAKKNEGQRKKRGKEKTETRFSSCLVLVITRRKATWQSIWPSGLPRHEPAVFTMTAWLN